MKRDCRLDLIGYVAELQDRFADPLRDKVKSELIAARETNAAADAFEALIVEGVKTDIDAAKFLKLYEAGKMTRAQFVEAISVRKGPALKVLSGVELGKISTESPIVPQMRVSRIKAVEVGLVDAVRSIAAAING